MNNNKLLSNNKLLHSKINKIIKDNKVSFVDYRFTDTIGTTHHITRIIDPNKPMPLTGSNFDGSSIPQWRGIEDSDMHLEPDFSQCYLDPFLDEPTLAIHCNALLPDGTNYPLCPRSIAASAQQYLIKTKVGTDALFGPEPEFFIFDSVQHKVSPGHSFHRILSEEADWSSELEHDGFNSGHRPHFKSGYIPLAPVDSMIDLRNEMCLKLQAVGINPELHHHEVATAGQSEIGFQCSSVTKSADNVQIFKYIVRNVAHQFGKTATFMPKPITGDNGSGMHVHQSIVRNGKNIFIGKNYGGLSQEALWYIGGILKHARALNAIANPTTNSYKRLLPGFEAPVKIAYSARNRSAAVRIPSSPEKARRIETRFPDTSANPYLCFSALMLAGLDGIVNKIDPGKPSDFNLYANTKEARNVKDTCSHLADSLRALDSGRKFLTQTGVFCDEMIDAFLILKWEEVARLRREVTPVEFDMYYSI